MKIFEETGAVFRVVYRAIKKGFGICENGGQRCPQFMRQVRKKLASNALQSFKLSYVEEHSHRQIVSEAGNVELKRASITFCELYPRLNGGLSPSSTLRKALLTAGSRVVSTSRSGGFESPLSPGTLTTRTAALL